MITHTVYINRYDHLLLTAILVLTILLIGTGAYETEVMPKDEKVVSILSLLLLFTCYLYKKDLEFIKIRIILGYFIFNIFFITRLYFSNTDVAELKTYLIHFISIGVFIATYFSSKQLLSSRKTLLNIDNTKLISIICILSLITILLSQISAIYTHPDGIYFRAGGFLSPNRTATIALILMFVVFRLSERHRYYTLTSVLLATAIILPVQSRAAILVLIPTAVYILFKSQRRKSILILLYVFLLFSILDILVASISLIDIIKSIFYRFTIDYSSSHRLTLLQQGWSSFLEAPIWGNDYRHLSRTSGFSTHNELIETLANFGLVGLLFFGIAFYFLYIPFTLIFFFVCIAPTFMFSHSFFDTYAFQAILGLALAVDRHWYETSQTK